MFEKQGKFGLYAAIVQFVIIVLYGLLVRYDDVADSAATSQRENSPPEGNNTTSKSFANFSRTYAMFQDIHVMIFIGFGFLMTFLKKYGYSAVGLNLFLAVLAIEWYIIVNGLFAIETDDWIIKIDLSGLVNADFAAAAILISFGAVLGKTSPLQLLFMVVIEVIAYTANNWINATYIKAADIGGSMVIHIFGAYFGLAVAFALKRRDLEQTDKEGSVYHSDLFSMIGTVFLWIFWPSFNAITGAEDDDVHRAIINTYLALVASCFITFIVSNCVGADSHRFNMVHVQNATLAGGVAVGTAADTMLQPLGAFLVGSIAGVISTLGYRFIQPFLLSQINLHDTCGVHNLHGMPGVLAGIVGVIMLALSTESEYGKSLYSQFPTLVRAFSTQDYNVTPPEGRTSLEQAGYQAATLVITLAIAIVTGLITGVCLRFPCFETPAAEHLFDDAMFWEIPEEGAAAASVVDGPMHSGSNSSVWHHKVAPSRLPVSLLENRVTLADEDKQN